MNRAGDTYSQAVKNAVNAGRKIDAIKLYREETGVGLKEAKHAIDFLAMKSTPTTDNSDMSEPGSGGASAIKLVVLIIVLVGAYKYFLAG
jgi:hypothetical protein